jgi:hypothetical protein
MDTERGIVNSRLTKCEMIQYSVRKKIMAALSSNHSMRWSLKVTMPHGTIPTRYFSIPLLSLTNYVALRSRGPHLSTSVPRAFPPGSSRV